MTEQIASCAVQDKEVLLVTLYQSVFPPFCSHIRRKGGSLEEAKDVFHDALIIYCEKDTAATTIADQKAYVFGIAKHVWNKKHREKQRYTTLDAVPAAVPSERQDIVSGKLLLFLKQTGNKCMEVLQAFYYENQNAEKIAERFGFSGVRSATVQKFKCLEKVRDLVKTNAQQYEDFLE